MKYFIRFLLAYGVFLAACDKAPYLTDEGLHSTSTPLSTYDYLAQHPAGLFDTLTLVIDHFGLKADVNESGTFFAPTDYSLRLFYNKKLQQLRTIDENATYSLAQMMEDITVDSLKAYLFNDRLTLAEATVPYHRITSEAGFSAFAYHKQLRSTSGTNWSSHPVYHLYFVKIRGQEDIVADDGATVPVGDDPADLRIRCQTTGIETASGSILHVLANTHVFISDFYYTDNE